MLRVAITLLIASVIAPWTSAAVAALLHGPDEGTLMLMRGCELRYRIHRPLRSSPGPVVLIAHGFMRNGELMSGWAEAIARDGYVAVTVDRCATAEAQGRHADHGADLVALRRALAIDDVLYVGVSAGGLVALIAAAQDSDATRGLLLLDPVNAGGQARSAAGRVHAPVAALVAKPQSCNAWRNIDPALETLHNATIVSVDGASHCDFEWPSDVFCRVACIAIGGRERRQRSESRIRELGLSFVRAVAQGEDSALYRWKGDIGAPSER